MGIETQLRSKAPPIVRYRNRDIYEEDVEALRTIIAEHDTLNRTDVYKAVCEAWDWRQANGSLSEIACRDLMLRLQEWGHIELPPSRRGPPKRRQLPRIPMDMIALMGLPVTADDADLDSLVVRPIFPEERLGWQIYMQRYHYLGYRPIVGEHILYAAFLGSELVALMGWASAAFRAPLREQYIGWSEDTKRKRLHFVANNIRFLILPWIRVPHLASKVLACNLRRLSEDWIQSRNHPIYLAETFVDTAHFRGTCYRAANWQCLGQTTGRTKRGNLYLFNHAPKALYVYPLHRQARSLLCQTT